jgi:hypothetical protein
MRGPIIGGLDAADVGKALGGIAIVAGVGFALTALSLRRRARMG